MLQTLLPWTSAMFARMPGDTIICAFFLFVSTALPPPPCCKLLSHNRKGRDVSLPLKRSFLKRRSSIKLLADISQKFILGMHLTAVALTWFSTQPLEQSVHPTKDARQKGHLLPGIFSFFVWLPQPLCTKEVKNERIAARDCSWVCYQAKSFLSLLVHRHFPLQAALKAKKHHKWWGHQHCCKWFAVPEQPCCHTKDGAGMSSIKVANAAVLQQNSQGVDKLFLLAVPQWRASILVIRKRMGNAVTCSCCH